MAIDYTAIRPYRVLKHTVITEEQSRKNFGRFRNNYRKVGISVKFRIIFKKIPKKFQISEFFKNLSEILPKSKLFGSYSETFRNFSEIVPQ